MEVGRWGESFQEAGVAAPHSLFAAIQKKHLQPMRVLIVPMDEKVCNLGEIKSKLRRELRVVVIQSRDNIL
jgi:hypothetical protein